MAGTIVNNPVVQFFDNNGRPLSGGKITTYLSNTTTPASTWQNEALSVLNTNPIILNFRGEATIWLTPDIQYTFVLTDADDNLIQTVNDIYGAFQPVNGMNASLISYTPEGTGAVATTVEDILDAQLMVDYVALRAYTGLAKTVRITGLLTTAQPQGIAGFFQYDETDTTSADNGGTVIVDGDGRRWKRVYDGPVNVSWFGTVRDGVTDDYAAIQAALDTGEESVFAPAGNYKTSQSIEVDGKVDFYGEGSFGDGTTIIPDVSVIEAIKIGSNVLFGGTISSIVIDRQVYSGATENIGFAFYDAANGFFTNLISNVSKYNFYLKPQNGQRVAYSQFINCTAIGGFYNWWGDIPGTGFANENILLGCRFITSANTDTQFRLDWGGNFFRFIGCSMEGTANYGLYFNLDGGGASFGHSLYVENCRFEGTFAIARIYLGANSQFCTINQHDFYGIDGIVDDGLNNYIFSGLSTYLKRGASNRTNPILTLSDTFSSSGDSNVAQVRTGRGTGKVLEVINNVSSAVLGGISLVSNSVSYRTAQSGFAAQPLVLGNYYLWVDTTGDLRIKNGVPTSDLDGTVVGTQT